MLPLAHAPAWIAASVLLVVAVICTSLAPSTGLADPAQLDKVEHAAAYLFLAVWFTGLVARPRYWLVVVALVVFGLLIEFLQAAMPFGRQGDPWDVLANVGGIGIGVALAGWVTGGWALKVEAWMNRS